MLPIPFSKYVPTFLADNSDDSMTSMMSKAESNVLAWADEIIEISYLLSPDRCPEPYLEELAYFVGADIYSEDTERAKRIKIVNAIATHSLRSTWIGHIKIIIDAITGLNSAIVLSTSFVPPVPIVKGAVYVNCHVGIFISTLTLAQIESIKAQLIYDVVPVYFYFYYGFINAGGAWVEYDHIT